MAQLPNGILLLGVVSVREFWHDVAADLGRAANAAEGRGVEDFLGIVQKQMFWGFS